MLCALLQRTIKIVLKWLTKPLQSVLLSKVLRTHANQSSPMVPMPWNSPAMPTSPLPGLFSMMLTNVKVIKQVLSQSQEVIKVPIASHGHSTTSTTNVVNQMSHQAQPHQHQEELYSTTPPTATAVAMDPTIPTVPPLTVLPWLSLLSVLQLPCSEEPASSKWWHFQISNDEKYIYISSMNENQVECLLNGINVL